LEEEQEIKSPEEDKDGEKKVKFEDLLFVKTLGIMTVSRAYENELVKR
jgi:hypothetical protein